MKNLLKNFKILVLVIFITSCESLNNNIVLKTEEPVKTKKVISNHYQPYVESRNLETIKYVKKKTKIALFLPFSGKNKDLGWQLFNAATLSLFDNDLNNDIELVLIDSRNTPQEAVASFQEIINEKIKVVIGPVFSDLVKSIEEDAVKNNITIISFSNNRDLIKPNNKTNIFLAGFLPETELEKITSYTIAKRKSNFAIIAPNNPYGVTMSKLFKTIVKSKDGNLVTSELYQPNNHKNIEKVVQKITHSSYSNAKSNLKDKYDSNSIYPEVIMIPDSGKSLSKVISAIKKNNVDEREFQIIGISSLNDISSLNESNLSEIWFAAPENNQFVNFEKKYYQIFNENPPRISSIAYDTIKSICEIMKRKGNTNLEFSDFSSYSKNGITGIDGIFRYLPNGFLQRNLAILKLNNGRVETIEEPVNRFLNY